MPVDALLSNWAYMVMATLAWTLEGVVWAVTGRPSAAGRVAMRRRKPPSCV